MSDNACAIDMGSYVRQTVDSSIQLADLLLCQRELRLCNRQLAASLLPLLSATTVAALGHEALQLKYAKVPAAAHCLRIVVMYSRLCKGI